MLTGLLRRLFGSPAGSQADFESAYRLYQEGALEAADEHCAGLIREGRQLGDACYLRGLIAQQRAQPAQAARYFRLALDHDDAQASFHLSLAQVLRGSGEPLSAASHFGRAAALLAEGDPAQVQALVEQCIALEEGGDPAGAQERWRSVLALDPDRPSTTQRGH